MIYAPGSKDPLTVKFADGGNKKKSPTRQWINKDPNEVDYVSINYGGGNARKAVGGEMGREGLQTEL